MKNLKYILQYTFIQILFLFFKLIGYRISSFISGYLFLLLGSFFRSKKIALQNIRFAFKDLNSKEIDKIYKKMWINYGKIFSEYVFIEKFRNSKEYSNRIFIKNESLLHEIKKNNEQVVFVSGHFDNFEFMAMQIEKSGINLATVYRPLNNYYLNPKMEKIRKNFICKNQIKKGISGTRELLKIFKKKNSIALMIDQRVSEGINSKFFGQDALTTTLPAQFVKKFNVRVVPIHIERDLNNNFQITITKPIKFEIKDSISDITQKLNKILENMIQKKPDQWIWTHNRWKQ